MTRINFYILADKSNDMRLRFVCRLTEKAWRQGHRIYIHTGDAELSRRLDDLLWSFSQNSFVPHSLSEDPHAAETMIHIGHAAEPDHHDEVMINLGSTVPSFFSRFTRVVEVIDGEPEDLHQGRERFRFYRDRGYPMETHNIGEQRQG